MSKTRICPVIDLDEITARTRRTANEIAILKMLIVVPMFVAGLVLAGIVVTQGAENIRQTQIQNARV
ncbi:MAG: hypothetical protein JWQ74_3562 [Marmoricola sp.]|nr:hypothetical protein [Marmoricola sp.]